MNCPSAVKPSRGRVATEALRRFRAEFQVYFPAAFVASLVAYLCVYLLESIREKLVIAPSYESVMEPERYAMPRLLYALGRTSLESFQWWVVWTVFVFMLASVALRLLQESYPTGALPIGEAFKLARTRRLGPLLGASALAAVAITLFSVFLLPVLLRPLPLLVYQFDLFRSYRTAYNWATAALTLFFAALLAKMSLAIPDLIDDENVSIGQSFRNSIRATAGWEIFFFLEFGILGLVGGTLYFAGQDLLAQRLKHDLLTSSGYELTLAALTILLASVALTLLTLVHSLVYISIRYGTATPLVKTVDAEI